MFGGTGSDEDLVQKVSGALAVNVEVFRADHKLLGQWSKGGEGEGEYRQRWTTHKMVPKRTDDRFHKAIAFSRASPGDSSVINGPIESGQRVPLAPGTSRIDVKRTEEFQEVLKGVIQWSRQMTIVLGRQNQATPRRWRHHQRRLRMPSPNQQGRLNWERLTEDEVQAAWARGETSSFEWAGFNLYFG